METKMVALTQYQIDVIRDAWCRETSADPANWSPENRAWGQCAVTALVVQDLAGGSLERVDVSVPHDTKAVSHYRNVVNGTPIDLTFGQFSNCGSYLQVLNPQARDRGYVLSFPATAQRYHLLKARAHQAYRELHTRSRSEAVAQDV
jgi:hypothetical protein